VKTLDRIIEIIKINAAEKYSLLRTFTIFVFVKKIIV